MGQTARLTMDLADKHSHRAACGEVVGRAAGVGGAQGSRQQLRSAEAHVEHQRRFARPL